MIARFIKFLIGLLLVPVVIGVSVTLYENLSLITQLDNYQLHFLLGAVSYTIIHLVFYKPTYLYILGHELIHVFSTWVCGGKVSSFHISSRGGSVSTTKSNFFIDLSPYFVPVYTIAISAIWFLASRFWDLASYRGHFIFLVGFSLTFHLVLTVEFLKIRQPDILKAGYLFSIALIYIANVAIIVAVLSALFFNLSFVEFLKSSSALSLNIYKSAFGQLFLH